MVRRQSGLNTLVGRLLTDREFQTEFRKDPEGYRGKYRVSKAQMVALLEADEPRLIALGLDPALLTPKADHSRWLPAALLRLGGAAAAVLIAAVVMVGTGGVANAATGDIKQKRTYIGVRRVAGGTRWVAHPIRARAAFIRASAATRAIRYFPAEGGAARFAGVRAYGAYPNQQAVLGALYNVDPGLAPVPSIGK